MKDIPRGKMIAELNKVHKAGKPDHDWEYLCIETDKGYMCHGGNQYWWFQYAENKPDREKTKKWSAIFRNAKRDEWFRLAFLGCGVIAMVDLELYCCSRIAEGIMRQKQYEEIVTRKWKENYHIDQDFVNLHVGLYPWRMEKGLTEFLRDNDCRHQKVKWAPYRRLKRETQKKYVLQAIKEMLDQNLPVVCSYHTFDPDHKKLVLYRDCENAINNEEASIRDACINSHYMTIIGLWKDGSENYYLKIVSWGEIFFVRFDKYAENLNLFTNILMMSE